MSSSLASKDINIKDFKDRIEGNYVNFQVDIDVFNNKHCIEGNGSGANPNNLSTNYSIENSFKKEDIGII